MNKSLLLNGEWRLSTTSCANIPTIPATLPGDTYSALLDAHVIPDPYYAKNELEVQRYAGYEWTFEREFTVDEAFLDSRAIFLDYAMADTFCTLRLNGTVVLETANAFCAYHPEVRSLLRPGVNTISFTFRPPAPEAERLGQDPEVASIPWCSNSVIRHNNLIRKVICHGGWDWGITLIVAGVYEDIRLTAVDQARIDYLYAEQRHGDGEVAVTAIAEVSALQDGPQTISFSFNGETKTVTADLKAGVNVIRQQFQVTNPRLWWPAGYGDQPLYPLTAAVDGDEKTVQLGLRTMEVISERDDDGKSFVVRVNGTDIFCKGADWIPCDALVSRQTPERYENLISSAVSANMNMLRVWGGGQYEREVFYELCDRKGVLVWQDLMFSCAIYPSTEWFFELLRPELEHNVKRLRHHASLALWCGDNECLGATRWHGEHRRMELTLLFDRLNRFLTPIMGVLDPERIFWPSSPCGGPGDLSDGWTNDNVGDMHYWQVWHGGKSFDAYYSVRPRFCSEFGYEAFPSKELVDTFCPPEEQNLFAPIMDHRQKCNLGNAPILAMFYKYFRLPETFESFLYLSQTQQALAIKTGVEFWRSTRPRCMGTLFWQLNDNWPTVSWSSIEYSGKWKQLQYHARRFFAPVMTTFLKEKPDQPLRLITVSDLTAPAALAAKVTAFDFLGRELGSQLLETTLQPGASLTHEAFDLSALVPAGTPDNGFFLYAETDARTDDGRQFSHQNTYVADVYKNLPMQPANIAVAVRDDANGALKVELMADRPAFYVTLDSPGIPGNFSDNSLTLLPGRVTTLTFTPWTSTPVTVTALGKAITVDDLRSTYR